MATSIDGTQRRAFLSFPSSVRQVQAGFAIGVSYFLGLWLSEKFIPHPATLFPAAGIALAGLFLGGIELWPFVFVAALLGYYFAGTQLFFVFVLSVAQVLQAVAGAYLLRKAQVDPLFRRFRDVFFVVLVLLIVSSIVPTITSFGSDLSTILLHTNNVIASWWARYVGTFFCLLVVTPFIMRWVAKPRFSRNVLEIVELVIVFGLLIALLYADSIRGVASVAGIPLVYILLVPFFWISLRMRPRFVTLAILIMSIIGILGLYITHIPTGNFTTVLFGTEELLIVLALIFLIITSLEEDRRLNVNLLRSHMATLENAVARISSESEAKNSFIAILAHELRNPLAPIMSSIDFLKMDENRDSEEKEALLLMEERMGMVRRLLDDLLDTSRIAEGKLTLKKERVELQSIIKRAIVSTTHLLRERHQALTFKGPKERLYLQADAARLEQIFSNLLTNASKYSDAGDQIIIQLNKVGDEAEIILVDMGVGISPDAMDDIFLPFHQLGDDRRSKKGLGIGLALVRSFVEMHDGTITASSKGMGQGSEFTVRLPLANESAATKSQGKHGVATAPLPLPSSSATSTEKTKPRGPVKVLVVDDNDAAAWGIGRLFEIKGCKVFYAYSGAQAIEEAETASPDVILLDIGLPDQNGYDTAKILRARGFAGRLIALTGYSTDDARSKGRGAGFDHFLVKPAGFEDLKRVIPEIA